MLFSEKSLYYIYDTQSVPCSTCFLGIIGFVTREGAELVQLRAKNLTENEILPMGIEILPGLIKEGIPLIINDQIGAAQKLLNFGLSTGGREGCVGLHIGQSDGSQSEARKRLGDEGILGVTVNNVEQAIEAQENGADYIGYGAIFPTETKKDAIVRTLDTAEEIRDRIDLPLYLIGGINAENLPLLTDRGFRRICISSAISKAKNPQMETKRIIDILGEK